ncbi:MAG TPA: TetR/AcrR family transcriptional regulator [Nevskia sp.]|jgi:AcrR family transcriptional regulator|nr:TetR/AcrR family transcriptional regulator [Nevskia sp.]
MAGLTASQARIHQAALRLFAEKGTAGVTMSELALAAGVARGTVHNNLDSPEALFNTVAAQLSAEMHQRVVASFAGIADPAHRLANGVRFFVRRAHEEPHWGRFINRFAFNNESLQGMWAGPPTQDVLLGMSQGRYDFPREQLPSVIGIIAGATLSAIFLVLEGHRAWRDAGSDAAELLLRALGVPAEEARRLSRTELPPLAEEY